MSGMSDDWQSRLEVLVKASKPVIKQFFERHERDELLAVGYVFELWNAGPQFDLVAHLGQPIQTEYRWNSGERIPKGKKRKWRSRPVRVTFSRTATIWI